ncbi:MAG: serine/threonine-protein kinase [Gemmatimonadales bacterium]
MSGGHRPTILGPSPDLEGRAALQDEVQRAVLGEFEILGVLGRGGMASVFLAHDIALDRRVAIKVLSPALFYEDDVLERFRREARLAASLNHPHIVPVHAVRKHGHLQLIVMKWIEGRSLDGILGDFGPLSTRTVQVVLAQIGGALEYAHRRGVIHRDVKPGNILLDDDGGAVISDFGIAKAVNATSLTTSGDTVGTPFYMSPEQCKGGEGVGPAADQYSLGCVAYELLTGRPPFVAESFLEVMQRQCLEEPIPIRTLRPDCPESLEQLVLRMILKDPESRWPTLDAMCRGLLSDATVAPDDPIRLEMITLARSGDRTAFRPSTPRSPVPVVTGTRPAAPVVLRRRIRSAVVGLVTLAAAVTVVWVATLDRGTRTTKSPASLSPAFPPAGAPAAPTASGPQRDSGDTTPARAGIREERGPSPRRSGQAADRTTDSTARSVAGPALTPSVLELGQPSDSIRPLQAWIRIGTRIDGVFLYINDVPHPLGPIRWWLVKPGQVRLRVRSTRPDCSDLDFSVTVLPGDSLPIGWRAPNCAPPESKPPGGAGAIPKPRQSLYQES